MTRLISLEDTTFIFDTNFSGDPSRDRFRSPKRKANVIINDIMLAREMIDEGFNVKMTQPREGEEEGFVPRYFISVQANYESKWPPKIYLVSGEAEPVLLDEISIDTLDHIRVESVDVILNAHDWGDGRSLYIKTMYVVQRLDDDPFASKYARRGRFEPAEHESPEEIPFK